MPQICEVVKRFEDGLYRAIVQYKRLPPGWTLEDLTSFSYYAHRLKEKYC